MSADWLHPEGGCVCYSVRQQSSSCWCWSCVNPVSSKIRRSFPVCSHVCTSRQSLANELECLCALWLYRKIHFTKCLRPVSQLAINDQSKSILNLCDLLKRAFFLKSAVHDVTKCTYSSPWLVPTSVLPALRHSNVHFCSLVPFKYIKQRFTEVKQEAFLQDAVNSGLSMLISWAAVLVMWVCSLRSFCGKWGGVYNGLQRSTKWSVCITQNLSTSQV